MRRQLGSIRKVGKSRWRIAASVGWDTDAHRRIRVDRTVIGTKTEAERELARILIEAGEVRIGSDVTIETYLTDVWLPHMKPPRVRERTWAGYSSVVNARIVPYLGKRTLAEVATQPLVFDRWLEKLKSGGVSGHTALHAYRVMKAALTQAVKWRLILTNPLDAVEAPKREPHEPRVLSAEEARNMLRFFRGSDIEPAIALALGAGMRRSEISGARWSDVSLEDGYISISRGRHHVAGAVIEEPPKTERSRRVVSLPDYAVEILKRHRQDSGYVLSDAQGAPMTPNALSYRYRKECEARGVSLVPLRDLRHTHATLLLEAGVDVVVVSRRLGHSNVTTTDRFYLRPSRAADELAAGMLDDLLAPTRAKSTVKRVKLRKASGE